MSTAIGTDADELVDLLDAIIETDPVRHTVLGTVRLAVEAEPSGAWWVRTGDGRDLAVRSSPSTPVVTVGAWADRVERAELVAALRSLPDLVAISGPVPVAADVAEQTGPVAHRLHQRLFRLDELSPPVVAGAPRRATGDHRPMVLAWYQAFAVEAEGLVGDLERSVDRALADRGVWLWERDGRTVSLAVRRPVVAGSARIGPVYTPPEDRGRGYGSAVTAAATRDILEDAAIPVLFTDRRNPTSNAIYARLGYRAVGDYVNLRMAGGH
jgi:predicted GNAT family acetyltransferase